MRNPLGGLRVLVTRPEGQAEPLCAAIEAAGGVALRLPLLGIEPAPAAQRRSALAALQDCDWWIFTSPNAVEQAVGLVDRWPQLAAVGAGTAAALQEATGRPVLHPPEAASSEALLQLAPFTRPGGMSFGIVTGASGLPLLQDRLSERGARVLRAELYRRVPLSHPAQTVADALRKTEVAVITSGLALERLVELTPPAMRGELSELQLVLPSVRVVEKAVQLGFRRPPRIAEPMSNAAILRCLAAAQPISDP